MTIALRTPTFRNSCGPSARHHGLHDELAGLERGALRADEELVDRQDRVSPRTDRTTIAASSADSTGSRSPAGDPVPRLPPMRGGVADLRRADGAGGLRQGRQRGRRAPVCISCVQVTPRSEPDRLALDAPADAARRRGRATTTSSGTAMAEVDLDHEVGAAGEHLRSRTVRERRRGRRRSSPESSRAIGGFLSVPAGRLLTGCSWVCGFPPPVSKRSGRGDARHSSP